MQKSKAALFLMELLIVLLFFSITGAVCLQLFSDAHITNKISQNISNANILLSNTAEAFYIRDEAGLCEQTDTMYYSYNLNPCDENDAKYLIVCELTLENNYWNNHITITDADNTEVLIEQTLTRYERMVKP